MAATLLRFAITPLVGHTGVPFITYFPAVLVASIWAGSWGGLTALVLSSVVAAYLWLEPIMSFMLSGASAARLAAFWLLAGLLIIISALLRALVRAVLDSEERAIILAHEMTHRVRNVLGLVHAISRQTFQNTTTLAEYHALFESRLIALGRAQELVIENPDAPTDLRLLLDRVLEPFDHEKFTLCGVSAGIPHEIGSTLALLIHELGTNSLKYGALSVPDGQIAVTWKPDGQYVRLDWQELNGPKVAPPARSGFGTRLLMTAFPPGRGDASIAYEPEGVHCKVQFPAATSHA